ncbi:hypothetical protein ELUMI_v1c04900 [Williamsoniiplasma luminosum]|uniref:Uncharacterized protein n=1 Tax=Williamsoniiplasma luminosum TaxID=214888 RepID=A0A2K8NTX8_9MOLU|nr:hypothetical protein [Williamsoniiplasma luminosum]ATZ17214.1 hypothetical protein ELUMI_v1c04900 [Williamsoniiplasma luminosum]
MKKLLFSTILTSSLLVSTSFTVSYTQNLAKKLEQLKSKQLEQKNIRTIDPTYPSFTIGNPLENLKLEHEGYDWSDNKKDNKFLISWKTYANSFEEFKQKYPEIQINTPRFITKGYASYTPQTNDKSNQNPVINTNTITQSTPPDISLENAPKFHLNSSISANHGGSSSTAKAAAGVHLYEENGNIYIKAEIWAQTWRNTAFWSPEVSAEIILGDITFKTSYDFSSDLSNYTAQIQSHFQINSFTSPWINSTETINHWTGSGDSSNQAKISDEIKRRVKNLPNKDEWNSYIDLDNPQFSINEAVSNGVIKIKLNKRGVNSTIENKFKTDFEMPVTIKFDDKTIDFANSDEFIKNIEFESTTSQHIDSTNTIDIWSGNNSLTSNKDLTIQEVTARISKFKNNKQWNKYIDLDKPIFTWNKNDPNNSSQGFLKVEFKKREGVNADFVKKFKLEYNIHVKVKFDKNGITSKINDVFAKTPFDLITNTSPIMNNESIIDDQDGSPNKGLNNKQVIEREIDKRFKTLTNSHPAIANNLEITNKKFVQEENKVIIQFKDAQSLINEGQWIQNIPIKVNVRPTAIALNRSFLQRISIKPGNMIDPKNPGKSVLDEPELIWDKEKPTFVYHNKVDFEFASSKSAKETVTVNGEPIEVYDNIFKKELLDQNLGLKPNEKYVQYDIIVNGWDKIDENGQILPQPKPRTINFSIAINSLISRSSFKWMAWDPVEDKNQPEKYQQWVLTQEKLPNKDGQLEANPKYDPTIDPKSGVRIQQVFVKTDKKYLDKHPFPLDPFDLNGNFIKPENGFNEKNRTVGYFAEAYVVNKGVLNLFQDKTFDQAFEKVERIQITDSEGKPVSSENSKPELVDFKNEGQFSSSGLYEYFFYVKDKAPLYQNSSGKKLNPADVSTYPPTGNNIPASAGNILHKFLFVSNKEVAYQKFTSLPFIKNNPDIMEFNSGNSLVSHRLKWYLINKYNFTTQQLDVLNYENNFAYWKEYVSAAIDGKLTPPEPGNNFLVLNQLKLDSLLRNQTDVLKLFKEIEAYAQEKVNKFAMNNKGTAIYKTHWDLYIDGVDVALNEFNAPQHLKHLANITDEIKSANFIIKAKDNVKEVQGETKFLVVNNPFFEPDKVLDLNKINWKAQEYNFSGVEEGTNTKLDEPTFRKKWIKDLMQKQLEIAISHVNPKGKPKYLQDYKLSVLETGLGNKEYDLEAFESIQKIEEFLSNSNSNLKIKVTSNPMVKHPLLINSTIQKYINNPDAPLPPIIPTPDVATDLSLFLNVENLEIVDLINNVTNPELQPEQIFDKNNQLLWNKLISAQKEKNNKVWSNDPESAQRLNEFLDTLNIKHFKLFHKDSGQRPKPNPDKPNEVLYKGTFNIKSNNDRLYYGSHNAEFFTATKLDPPPVDHRKNIEDLFPITNIGEVIGDGDDKYTKEEVFEKLIQMNAATYDPKLFKIEYFTFRWFYQNKPSENGFDHSMQLGISTEGENYLYGSKLTINYWTTKKDKDPKPPVIDPYKPIIANISDESMTVGDKNKIITVDIENPIKNKEISVKSSDNAIAKASVNYAGKIVLQAIAEGTVTITVSYPEADDVTFQLIVNRKEIINPDPGPIDPEKPDPGPIDPEKPNPDPGGEKPNPDKDKFSPLNLLWIIPLALIGVGLIFFIGKRISIRRKSRRIGKR